MFCTVSLSRSHFSLTLFIPLFSHSLRVSRALARAGASSAPCWEWRFFQNATQVQLHGGKIPIVLYQEMKLQFEPHVSIFFLILECLLRSNLSKRSKEGREGARERERKGGREGGRVGGRKTGLRVRAHGHSTVERQTSCQLPSTNSFVHTPHTSTHTYTHTHTYTRCSAAAAPLERRCSSAGAPLQRRFWCHTKRYVTVDRYISMDPRETLSIQIFHTHRTCRVRTRLVVLWPPRHYHESLKESWHPPHVYLSTF